MERCRYIVVKLEAAGDERGMTVAELARRSDIPRKRLWYILDGQRQLRADELVRLGIVLGMGMSQFVPREMIDRYEESGRRTLEDYGRGTSPVPPPRPRGEKA